MKLTEDQVRERLRKAIAKWPSQLAFAKEHRIQTSVLSQVLTKSYNPVGSGGFPPQVLNLIKVKKRTQTIYELVDA